MFNFLSRLLTSRQRRFPLSRHRTYSQGLLGNPLIRMVLGGLVTYAVRRFSQRRRYA